MKVEAYSVAWNEEKFLPHYLRWYTSFCEKVIIYDNYSTDNSVKIIKSFPNTEIRLFDSNGRLDDDINVNIKNNCWKESNADYVIISDIDEILYHENIIGYLNTQKQYSVIESQAFEMISKKFPAQDKDILSFLKYGIPRTLKREINKKTIFDPKRIEEINYRRGCHRSNPKGDVNILELEKSEIKFLHCKYLSKEYLVNRYIQYKEQRNPDNPILHTFNKKILEDKFNKLWKRRIKVL